MSTPHIEHFVDERGNFIYRAEFEGSFLSKDEAKELAKHVSGILDENAKLREEIAKARDPQRIGGQADPSSFVYAIEQLREFRWQHATNDEDAIPYINNVAAAHERENAKLRELVRDMWFGLYCPTEPTDGCPQCPFNRDGECFFEQRMRELGVDA